MERSMISQAIKRISAKAPRSCPCATVMHEQKYRTTEYIEFLDRFIIPSCYPPLLPSLDQTALDVLSGHSILYLSLFTIGNFRFPLNKFFLDVLDFFQCHISLLNPYGAVRLSSFVVACKACGSEPALPLFRSLFTLGLAGGCTLGNHPVTIAAIPFSVVVPEGTPDESIVGAFEGSVEACIPSYGTASAAPLVGSSSKGKKAVSSFSRGLKRGRFGDSVGDPSSLILTGEGAGFIGPLATSKENSDSDSFLPGDVAAYEAHDILSKLDYPEIQRRLDGLSLAELVNFHDVFALRFVMSNNMLNRETRSLSLEILKLCEVVFKLKVGDSVVVYDLRVENEKMKKDIAGLQELSQLVGSSKDILEVDVEALRSRCCKFDEKDAIMLATEASLKAEIESLKEKLESTIEDRSLMKKSMLVGRAQAFEEVAGMDLGFQLKDVKDYDPDAVEAFDKAVDDFYRVDFPYFDLLAYHARKSLGFLKYLKPPSLPPRMPSVAGSSSSPFI
ncbi:hypothetical protein Tco_0059382 [Tanacetum coccineum]